MFDVETLGVESNCVVLSAAMVHFDPEKRPTYQDLLDNACFVKFDVKQQLTAGRSASKSTLGWWKDQPVPQEELDYYHGLQTWASTYKEKVKLGYV
jgi:hypothetical protein